VDLFLEKIERGSNQAQYTGEQESGSDGFSCSKSGEQHEGRDRKTSPTDPGQPDSYRNEKSDKEIHVFSCVEKV
jgi:hypothetical protein